MMNLKNFSGVRKLIFLFVFMIMLFGLNESAQAMLLNNKISGDIITAGDVDAFSLSPDGRYVAFVADALIDDVYELFIVPTIGGPAVSLYTAPSSDMIVNPQFTPNGEYLVFLVGGSDLIYDMYLMPITGGWALLIFEDALIPHGDFRISNDSQQIFFKETVLTPVYYEIIWRIPFSSGLAVRMTPEACHDCWYDYEISSDSQNIAYLEWSDTFSYLYRSDLNANRHPITPNQVEDFKISPDGSQVVFIQEAPGPIIDLCAAPMNGDPVQFLTDGLVDGAEVKSFEITPDSSKVVYLSDESLNEQFLLYGANIDGSDNWPLFPGLVIPSNRDVVSYQITPNSVGVVFQADPIIDNRFDIFIVSVLGGTSVQLNKTLTEYEFFSNVQITPNSQGVVYLAENSSGQEELYAAYYTGAYEVKLNSSLPDNSNVSNFKISPNSQGVVYVADQEIYNEHNLYTVPVWGGMTPVPLNEPLISGGNVLEFSITPDSKGVIYRADQLVNDKWELFVTYDYQVVFLPMVIK